MPFWDRSGDFIASKNMRMTAGLPGTGSGALPSEEKGGSGTSFPHDGRDGLGVDSLRAYKVGMRFVKRKGLAEARPFFRVFVVLRYGFTTWVACDPLATATTQVGVPVAGNGVF